MSELMYSLGNCGLIKFKKYKGIIFFWLLYDNRGESIVDLR